MPDFEAAGAGIAEADASINIAYPAGIAAGHLLICHTYSNDNVDHDYSSSGFTPVGARNQGTTRRHEWAYRWATGSESGTFTVSKASGTVVFAGRCYRISGGLGSGTPHEGGVDNGTGQGASSTITPLDPSVTDGSLVVILTSVDSSRAMGDFTGGTLTVPEAIAEFTTTIGNDGTLHIAVVDAASTGTFDCGSQSITSAGYQVFSFAILPGGGTEHQASASLELTLGITTAAKKDAKASATVPLTFGATVAAKKTVYASASLSMTVGIVTAAAKDAKGSASLGLLVGVATAAKKNAQASTVVPIVFQIDSAGDVGGAVFGAASLDLTFGASVTAKKDAKGAASLPLAFGVVSAGQTTRRASSALDLSVGVSTVAKRDAHASATVPLVVNIAVAGIVGELAEPEATQHTGTSLTSGRTAPGLASGRTSAGITSGRTDA